MRIDRFAVRDFRKLAGGAAVEGLEPGITVIVGDNEEGKSTLLKALQSAFFDRHNLTGQGVEQMMPFGAKGMRPLIEVEFELAGTGYRLEKAFGRNPAALLESGSGGPWAGEAAEDRLRELLGFSRPGRGAANEEHRGLAGLLWVEQGRAFQPLGMNRDSQAVLREAIEGEVGQVLGGERGRLLLDRVETRAGGYYTRTGREREALTGPRKRVEEFEEQCEALEAELQAYDDKVKRLGQLQEALARYEREGALARAREEAAKAEDALRRLAEVEGRLRTAEAQMGQAESAAEAAGGARRRRAALVEEAETVARQAGEAEAALKELEPDFLDAERSLAEAEERLACCNNGRGEANAGWEAARRALERAELAAGLRTLGERLEQAEALEERIEHEEQALAADPVDEDAVSGLRDMRARQIRLEAALEAAAATLVFSPEDGRSVTLHGQPVDTSAPLRVTANSAFHLQDFGVLEVAPGGQDLARLRADLSELEGRLRGELRRLDRADLAAAEAALRGRQALQARVESLRGELRGLAPDGLEALRDTARERRARLSALAERDAGEAPDVETAEAAERAALAERDEAERAAGQAAQEREEARKLHDRLREGRIKAGAEHRQKAEAAAGRRASLEEERRDVSDEELEKRAGTEAEALAARRAAHDAVLAERDAMNPEALRIERQRAEEALDRLGKRIADSERAERDLAVELRATGQRGLAEELEQKRGELEIARNDLARTEADAKAWKLLLETLRGAEREAKETFLGPVRERLRPYLRMLFPETELQLNEDDLEIVSLKRDGVEEPFAALSIGAREQVAVLTRLALADLLREKGRPVALILDDPLVNSDDERFRRMELALRKAAASLQIVVLTCHEARYESLGAKIVRLADCRMQQEQARTT